MENFKERTQRHANGYVPATRSRFPVEILFYYASKDKYKAFAFEPEIWLGESVKK